MTAQTPFWNKLFDSRYEALMRNPKWPPLKVTFLNIQLCIQRPVISIICKLFLLFVH